MLLRQKHLLGLIGSLAWFCSGSEATIRIVESGREYRSWPDEELGPGLDLGEVYKARLQQLKGNSHLCLGPEANWNVTVPEDGSPGKLILISGMNWIQSIIYLFIHSHFL